VTGDAVIDGLERIIDEAGWDTAHIAGNSLGGHTALRLAARGRARSVVALAPAGGWAQGDDSWRESLAHFLSMDALVKQAAPHADAIMATPEGRRRATMFTAVNYEHIPAELLAHMLRGAAECPATVPFIENARREGWALDPQKVECPLRFVWGTEDRLLPWPRAAARYRAWFPQAEWVELEDVGHCPQLDVPLEAAQLILGFR
jgi:pimeloyl-ACP methyl ester carboxylesterase